MTHIIPFSHSQRQRPSRRPLRLAASLLCLSALSGCAIFTPLPEIKQVTPPARDEQSSFTLVAQGEGSSQELTQDNKTAEFSQTVRSAPLLRASQRDVIPPSLSLPKQAVSINADGLPLNHFIHLALGEVLGLNYLVDQDLADKTSPVTLRVNQPVSAERMLGLVEEVLQLNQVALALDNDIIKVIPASKSSNVTPSLMQQSLQPVLRYGNVARIIPIYYLPFSDAGRLVDTFLNENSGGKVLRQFHLNSLMVVAKQDDIERLEQLLQQLDVPNQGAKFITLVTPRFLSQEELMTDLRTTLAAAGINTNLGNVNHGVSVLALAQNQLLVTASNQAWLDYAQEWIKRLDVAKPIQGNQGIYAYYMQNTKAEDAWQVVSAIFGDSDTSKAEAKPGVDLLQAAQQAQRNNPTDQGVTPGNTGFQALPSRPRTQMQINTENYRVVVDSKQNALFFTGQYQDYQRLVELLEFVDQRPRQVLLQATIAEVSLKDEFNLGFNFNINNGDITGGTKGIGDLHLNLVGVFGDVSANFNAALENGRVQILSNPRIIALDQEPARITVGDQIQVRSGEVTSGENNTNTTVTYKYIDIGLTLDITPSINQNGLVELTISQEVSSQGVSTGDSPSIARRSLQTKVLADSGDTVYLGGLIRQSTEVSETKVPLLGDIPLLGNLFKYQSQRQNRVELVLLITPYVIASRDESQFYTREFREITGWQP
ncbi:secretin N-terminal domain-containing protein [Vibrio metschnikovii]|uniref:secretin N-terminal domain-containing protein n=1 Tax=Vibrio metschnikovii TaxID=28172 RepID=UPI001C30D78F|nr:secretin N-terminal domain-containing protein [Vibrio metschnikovii]